MGKEGKNDKPTTIAISKQANSNWSTVIGKQKHILPDVSRIAIEKTQKVGSIKLKLVVRGAARFECHLRSSFCFLFLSLSPCRPETASLWPGKKDSLLKPWLKQQMIVFLWVHLNDA